MAQKENVQFQMLLLMLLSENDEVDNDSDIEKNCDHELRSLLRIGERKRAGWA